jgi:type I restriction enzyme M protein
LSDGQMLFLANVLSKMKQGTPLGSRIVEVRTRHTLLAFETEQSKFVPNLDGGE